MGAGEGKVASGVGRVECARAATCFCGLWLADCRDADKGCEVAECRRLGVAARCRTVGCEHCRPYWVSLCGWIWSATWCGGKVRRRAWVGSLRNEADALRLGKKMNKSFAVRDHPAARHEPQSDLSTAKTAYGVPSCSKRRREKREPTDCVRGGWVREKENLTRTECAIA